jgi:hypothetical protein
MLRYHCRLCGAEIRFDTMHCPVCAAPHGYVADAQVLATMAADADGITYHLAGDAVARWRCLNAAWGCNWTVPAGTGDRWCLSCALTRGRPDTERPDAIEAWSRAEAAKRHLVDQLLRLGLPIEPRSPQRPNGLTFDLVDVPGERGLTGHLDGVVTIDLAEADDVRRDELRRALGEPFRTLLGNMRHEVGHHYWARLVGQGRVLAEARRLFADERIDYTQALERHYASPGTAWDATRFVSRYAAVHPLEDWAETFAHYLHLVDAVETADAHGLARGPGGARVDLDAPLHVLLGAWLPLGAAIDAVAEAVGSPPPFPFHPVGLVVDKLSFVHDTVRANRRRGRFYDTAEADTGR